MVQGDSLLYGDIAANWLNHGIYGHSVGHDSGITTIEPTLVRLPGYPAFLALCFAFFGTANYRAVVYIQVLIDLGTCLLTARLARKLGGPRAARFALLLAALCPFTANYVAFALTETLSIFCVALGFLALVELLERPRLRWAALLTFSWSYSPCAPGWRPAGRGSVGGAPGVWPSPVGAKKTVRLALITGLLSLLPFVPWTIRNLRTFHVFQPLAPRYANDPGEFAAPGFVRWVKSFAADFTTTSEIYWNGNSDRIELANLPSRAIDDPAQSQETQSYCRITTTSLP